MVRFVVDDALLERLAHWRGNVSALHREMVADADGQPVPSLATLHRAVQRATLTTRRAGTGQPYVRPPDPGGVATADDIALRLRVLRGWAAEPSFTTITNQVNDAWTKAGRPGNELAGRTTVVDCFRMGRRRLNTDLIVAIVRALHSEPGYVAPWHQALLVVGGEQRAAAQVRVYDEFPPDLPGFTGRTSDVHRLRRALTAGGPVVSTIEGMAGVGKTWLAVHVAHLLHAEKPYRKVLFVNLRGFHHDPRQPPADPAAVLDGFLRLLGVPGPKIPYDLPSRTRLYRQLLGDERSLVVLDNAADVDQVRPLLPAGPVLITSRRSLAARQPTASVAVDVFSRPEALRFLRRGASSVAAGEDPEAATRIVELCGRLPLALGLVAAQIAGRPDWTLTDHAERLRQRHQGQRLEDGVELAIDLSYQRLDAERQRLLRLLALHPAEDLDAYAAAALIDSDLDGARAGLRRLCDDHLIQAVGHGRYTLHDLIRVHATVRAHDHERPHEIRAALTRLFDYYLSTVAAAMNVLHPGDDGHRPGTPAAAPGLSTPEAVVAWLDGEQSTLVGVAAYAAEHGWPAHALDLARTLSRYLSGAHNRVGVAIHEQAVRAARLAGDLRAQAKALTDVGGAHLRLGEATAAVSACEQAIDLFRRLGDPGGQAGAEIHLGNVELQLSNLAAAAAHHQRALALFAEAGDRTGEARALINLGVSHRRLGDLDAAIGYLTRGLTLHRDVGDGAGTADALNGIGHAETITGRYDAAGAHLREAVQLYRQLGSRNGEAGALDGLGLLHLRLGQPETASDYHRQSLVLTREIGNRGNEAWALNGLAECARALDQFGAARDHHEAALAIAAEIGAEEQQARAYAGLGHVYAGQGAPELARENFQRALDIYAGLGMPEADELRGRLRGTPPRSAPCRR
ncbi:tetratricopeptide repeat protein [Actinoplanes philippinensis]|uniref:tetratricopeptide repeat protein n=1 Tax=Actinoplanes philippinensis TaxID=35752 RepID=UPI003F4D5960